MLTEQAVKLLDVDLVIVGSTAIMMEAEVEAQQSQQHLVLLPLPLLLPTIAEVLL